MDVMTQRVDKMDGMTHRVDKMDSATPSLYNNDHITYNRRNNLWMIWLNKQFPLQFHRGGYGV